MPVDPALFKRMMGEQADVPEASKPMAFDNMENATDADRAKIAKDAAKSGYQKPVPPGTPPPMPALPADSKATPIGMPMGKPSLARATAGGSTKPDPNIQVMGAGPFFVHSANKAFWEFVDKAQDTAYAQAQQPLTMLSPMGGINGLRLILPRELMHYIAPDPAIMPPENEFSGNPELVNQKKILPTDAAKYITGPIGRALGDPLNAITAKGMGGLVKSYISAIGAQEGGEVGGEIGDKLGGDTGRAVGSIGLGIVGGAANVAKGEGIWEGGKVVGKALARPFQAFSQAREAQRAAEQQGQQLGLWQAFSDQYKDLKEQTKGYADRKILQQMSDAMRSNPDTKKLSDEFDAAASRLGMSEKDIEAFSVAERSKNPQLLGMQSEHRPPTPESTNLTTVRQREKQGAIARAYERIVGGAALDDTKYALTRAWQDASKTAVVRLRGKEAEEAGIRDQIVSLNPEGKQAVGETITKAYEAERNAVKARFEQEYPKVFALAPEPIDVETIGKEAKGIVQSIAGQAIPQNVPTPIRRLNEMFTPKKGPDGVEMPADPVSFKDLHEISSELGKHIHSAIKNGDHAVADNLSVVDRAITDALTSHPKAGKAYTAIQEAYRTQFKQRFDEGLQANLQRETGGGSARPNSDYWTPESVAEKFHNQPKAANETAMQDFDKVFGGKEQGTVRNEQAYKALGADVEHSFKEQVLKLGNEGSGFSAFDEAAAQKFMRDHGPAISRIPGLEAKLDGVAKQVYKSQLEQAAEKQRYKDLLGGDISKAIGPQQANALFAKALSSPVQAAKLVQMMPDQASKKLLIKEVMQHANPFVNGEFDSDTLMKVVTAGVTRPGEMSGLERMARNIYGDKEGAKFIQGLKDVATLAAREQLGRPQYLRPVEGMSRDPLKEVSGQSGASWVALLKNSMEGRTSPLYAQSVAIGRYASVRLRQSLELAEQKMLYEPKILQAMQELYKTKGNEPISHDAITKVLEPMGEEGKRIIGEMVNKGYVLPSMVRSGLQGGLEADREKREKEKNAERLRAMRALVR